MPTSFHPVKSALLGLVVGDALGVPVEFLSRSILEKRPVVDMQGFGTHHQPPGTWSDDSSLALCLAEVLAEGFDLQKLANSFIDWLFHNRWTPHGRVFDVGMATRDAIQNLARGVQPQLAGGKDEYSNGNGSLMRILPLLFFLRDKNLAERFELTRQVSSLTHAHPRSVAACFYYLEFARLILEGSGKLDAYLETNRLAGETLSKNPATSKELPHFQRILTGVLPDLSASEIRGSGYVVHTLEASLWCVLNSESYREAVLKAVNLGDDTDTTGAVTGGIAGLIFGGENIPAEWISKIARRNEIEDLIERLAEKSAVST